jgi:hypothetical protein
MENDPHRTSNLIAVGGLAVVATLSGAFASHEYLIPAAMFWIGFTLLWFR